MLLQPSLTLPTPDVHAGISLGTQLLAAAGLLVVMVIIHAAGIIAATKLLRLEDRRLTSHRVDVKAFGLLISIALSLFALHLIEISVFAFFYLYVGALDTVEEALYYSASAYSTLGHPDLNFPHDWRVLGAIEGLVGFVLIGWTTAVFIADMNKVLRDEGLD